MTFRIDWPAAAFLAVLVVGLPSFSQAAEEHHHESQPAARLTLNQGKPWTTDASLRKGMEAIRHDLEAALPGIHAGTHSHEQYAALAKSVGGSIDFMLKNCRLPPETDAQLHLVLERILRGIGVMEGATDPSAGAVDILQALEEYASHFDHPGWKALAH